MFDRPLNVAFLDTDSGTVRLRRLNDKPQQAMASPAMGHWGTCPPRLPTILFLVHFGVNLTANYPNIV